MHENPIIVAIRPDSANEMITDVSELSELDHSPQELIEELAFNAIAFRDGVTYAVADAERMFDQLEAV